MDLKEESSWQEKFEKHIEFLFGAGNTGKSAELISIFEDELKANYITKEDHEKALEEYKQRVQDNLIRTLSVLVGVDFSIAKKLLTKAKYNNK